MGCSSSQKVKDTDNMEYEEYLGQYLRRHTTEEIGFFDECQMPITREEFEHELEHRIFGEKSEDDESDLKKIKNASVPKRKRTKSSKEKSASKIRSAESGTQNMVECVHNGEHVVKKKLFAECQNKRNTAEDVESDLKYKLFGESPEKKMAEDLERDLVNRIFGSNLESREATPAEQEPASELGSLEETGDRLSASDGIEDITDSNDST